MEGAELVASGIKPLDLGAIAERAAAPSCGRCRFMLQPNPSAPKMMICRRNPPTATVIMVPGPAGPARIINGKPAVQMGMKPEVFTAWPEVSAEMGCFAFEPKPTVARVPAPSGASDLAAGAAPGVEADMAPRSPG